MAELRTQPALGRIRQVHMVGIGGIGMSSIAEVLLNRGDGAHADATDAHHVDLADAAQGRLRAEFSHRLILQWNESSSVEPRRRRGCTEGQRVSLIDNDRQG